MYEVIIENLEAAPHESCLLYKIFDKEAMLKFLDLFPNIEMRHEEPERCIVYGLGNGHKTLTITKI